MPGVIGATAAVAGGAMVIKGIDRKLDYTLAQLGTQVLQTTTIDPDSSFGGMVILPLGHRAAGPADIRVSIRFDGRPYLFGFTRPRPAWRRRPIFRNHKGRRSPPVRTCHGHANGPRRPMTPDFNAAFDQRPTPRPALAYCSCSRDAQAWPFATSA
jgi:hypothetical protein